MNERDHNRWIELLQKELRGLIASRQIKNMERSLASRPLFRPAKAQRRAA